MPISILRWATATKSSWKNLVTFIEQCFFLTKSCSLCCPVNKCHRIVYYECQIKKKLQIRKIFTTYFNFSLKYLHNLINKYNSSTEVVLLIKPKSKEKEPKYNMEPSACEGKKHFC